MIICMSLLTTLLIILLYYVKYERNKNFSVFSYFKAFSKKIYRRAGLSAHDAHRGWGARNKRRPWVQEKLNPALRVRLVM